MIKRVNKMIKAKLKVYFWVVPDKEKLLYTLRLVQFLHMNVLFFKLCISWNLFSLKWTFTRFSSRKCTKRIYKENPCLTMKNKMVMKAKDSSWEVLSTHCFLKNSTHISLKYQKKSRCRQKLLKCLARIILIQWELLK